MPPSIPAAADAPPPQRLGNASGRLQALVQGHGGLQALRCAELSINLFAASALEPGPANLWLRCHGADGQIRPMPLLGPTAAGRQHRLGQRLWHEGLLHPADGLPATGQLHYRVELVLADTADAWFWHITLRNLGPQALDLDLVYLQDVALAPWHAVRLNEAYVSQYLDHQPLVHARHGWLLATRQNQPVQGRSPWLLSGSLGRTVAYATDALQVLGLARRAGQPAGLLDQPLPGQRLQHEHALVALQESQFTLAPGATAQHGFYGWLQHDHPAASGEEDLATVARVLALPEARAPDAGALEFAAAHTPAPDNPTPDSSALPEPGPDPRNLFAYAAPWPSDAPRPDQLEAWFGGDWRQVERDAAGQVLSFFVGSGDHAAHVVTRDQDHRVLRPHGHLLRSGSHWTPDEQGVASTVWMAGVFHSSLTQGHASANRLLSTQRGYLGLFHGLGLRIFVDAGAGWQLLDSPSSWRLTPQQAVWRYQAGARCIEVVADAAAHAPEVGLRLCALDGTALRVLVTHHLAINSPDGSDDGLAEGVVSWRHVGADTDTDTDPAPDPCADDTRTAHGTAADLSPDTSPRTPPGVHADLLLQPGAGSALASRFGVSGGLRLRCDSDGHTLAVRGDEALFLDGRSRRLPYLCLQLDGVHTMALTLTCTLVPGPSAMSVLATVPGPQQPPPLHWLPPQDDSASQALSALADWMPWLAHNALVHYLSPRGLEQFSGGGWGTRDVCQGPTELLLALGRHADLRDLLCRVFSAQNPDGDWPQWFMFYPRDAHIRAGDSHGDIVFWPLVALADYLLASGDATLLAEPLPYHGAPDRRPLSEHVARALAVVRGRTIAGTELAAYGHGDWNDALQPADPAMREHLCSAWTVTLHHRMLRSLAAALRHLDAGQHRVAGPSGPSGPAIPSVPAIPAIPPTPLADQAGTLEAWADAVLADFQRLLVVDGVVTGYASFEQGVAVDYLLHPRDLRTGIHYSALPMVHAILDGLFSPTQAAAHADLIERELLGPDGLRLFDRPLRYRGGPMTLFQRGESASYFGREIGLMYMHAHLRWAEALAELGRADALLHALRLANPIGLSALLAQAAPRQRNCYYSSSDAAFADRDQAWLHYDRINRGEVALEGGWRIYSSGAGIAYRLVVQRLLGLNSQQHRLGLDPVLSPALDGLRLQLPLYGHPMALVYRVGPRGYGPQSVLLDGVPLATQPGHNRYRTAGVWLDAGDLRARLAAGARQLVITLG